MKYPKLTGICKIAIEHEWCTGCNKLELENFTGVEKCKWVEDPHDRIKRILGTQEKLF